MGQGQQLKEILDKKLPRQADQSPEKNGTGADRSFKDIELDDDETAEALRSAREEKFYRLARIEYTRKIRDAAERPTFTAEDVLVKFKAKYDVEPESRYEVILKHLCAYFTEDPRGAYDPQKGLFVCGGVGIGKTTLMEFFQRNQKASYRIVSCRDVESAYGSTDRERGGENAIGQYSYNFTIPSNSNPFGHRELGYCFDDLGTEVTGKLYGKEKEVMIEVILNRYDNKVDHFYTHVTTNLGSVAIKDRYGFRVFDRMREMFNIIDFPADAKSRRK
jgi:DNA replication protein DnaC